MDMNRRKVLVGLGAAAAGTGVVFGTGAFTQVEAERTVNVQVADDSAAFLQIESENAEFTNEVGGGAGGQVLEIELDSLNDNANTTVDPIISVTNTGSQAVDLSIEGVPAGVDLVADDGTSLGNNSVTLDEDGGAEPSVTLGIEVALGEAENLDDINGGRLDDTDMGEVTLTLVADADSV